MTANSRPHTGCIKNIHAAGKVVAELASIHCAKFVLDQIAELVHDRRRQFGRIKEFRSIPGKDVCVDIVHVLVVANIDGRL